MKRLLFSLLPLVALAQLPSNTITIVNSGSGQEGRPFSIGRVFARGEMPAFGKPFIVGTGVPAVWQMDVKTRWRDGAATCGITGATATRPILVTTNGCDFQSGETVTITGVGGIAAANGTFKIVRESRNRFVLPNTNGSGGSYTSGGTVSGPGPGSVQHAIVSFRATVPNGSTTIRFDASADPCSAGNQSACDAAALDEAGMLAVGSWEPTMAFSASGTTITRNARTMVDAGAFTYWLRGPAATQVIVRDHSPARAFDFGFDCTSTPGYCTHQITGYSTSADTLTISNHGITGTPTMQLRSNGSGWDGSRNRKVCVVDTNTVRLAGGSGECDTFLDITDAGTGQWQLLGDLTQAAWVDDASGSQTKPISPAFILTFYPGWSGVKVDYSAEITYTHALKDQRYSLALQTQAGGGTPVYTKATFTHFQGSRWRKTYWDGVTPGAVKVDHNRTYLGYSKVIPELDPAPLVALRESDIAAEYTEFLGKSRDITGNGMFYKAFGTTGGRPEIGLMPRWVMHYLYSFDPRLEEITWHSADVYGHVAQLHYREGSTEKYLVDIDADGNTHADADDSASGAAFGKPLSPKARPTWAWMYTVYSSATANDQVNPVAQTRYPGTGNDHGWTVDHAHQANPIFVPYILTGDFYWLEEMQFWASYNSLWNSTGWRRRGAGILNQSLQTRGVAWSLRNAGLAAFATPDGTMDKIVFREIVDHTLQATEGFLQIKDGNYFNPMDGADPVSNPCPSGSYNSASFVRTQSTSWCLGMNSLHGGRPALLTNAIGFPDSYFIASNVPAGSGWVDSSKASGIQAPWQVYFMSLSLSYLTDLGLPAQPVRDKVSQIPVAFIKHPDANPYHGDAYMMPQNTKAAGDPFFQDWASLTAAFANPARSAFGSVNDAADGYVWAHQAAVAMLGNTSYYGGTVKADEAYTWMRSNVSNQQRYISGNPANRIDLKWAIVPRISYEPGVLAIVTESLSGGTVDSDYSQSLSATGGTSPYSWSVITGTLPAGLTLSGDTISGTPTTAGVFQFDVRVTDDDAATDDATLTSTVTEPPVVSPLRRLGGRARVSGGARIR